jgi:hypothetical protein
MEPKIITLNKVRQVQKDRSCMFLSYDPKDKCIYKYKCKCVCVHVYNMFAIGGLFDGTSEMRERKREI